MFRDVEDVELRSILVLWANSDPIVRQEWYVNFTTAEKQNMIRAWNGLYPAQVRILKETLRQQIA